MKRTVISLALALAIVFSLVLVAAPKAQAAEHQNHCACAGKYTGDAAYHTCEEITQWTPLTNEDLALSSTLIDGNYYLTEDITLVSPLIIMDSNVVICLNGHNLQGNPEITGSQGRVLYQTAFTGTLTITDCAAKEGVISSSVTDGTGGVFHWKNFDDFVLNIYAGTIKGAQVSSAAGGAIRYQNGTLNMYGGVIEGGYSATYGGNVAVYANFNMYGGIIRNGTAEQRSGNLYIGGNGKASLYGGKIYGGTCPQNVDVWLFLNAETGAHGELTLVNLDSSFNMYYDATTYLDITNLNASLSLANQAPQVAFQVVKEGYTGEVVEPTEPSVEPTEAPQAQPTQPAGNGDNAAQEQPMDPTLWIVIGVAAAVIVAVVIVVVLKKKKA